MSSGSVPRGWKRSVLGRCVRKVQHPTEAAARAAMIAAEAAPGAVEHAGRGPAEPYLCCLCGSWHWGHPSQWPPFPPEVVARFRPWVHVMRRVREGAG